MGLKNISEPVPECSVTADGVKGYLMLLAQQRRFWRPVMKFMFGGTSTTTVMCAVFFYVVLTNAACKKMSFFNVIVPFLLLMGMECATDCSNRFLSDMARCSSINPAVFLYKLLLSLMIATTENLLWITFLQFYKEDKLLVII